MIITLEARPASGGGDIIIDIYINKINQNPEGPPRPCRGDIIIGR
jgi:hypothetical protein